MTRYLLIFFSASYCIILMSCSNTPSKSKLKHVSGETSSQSSPEKLLLSNHKDYDVRVGWASVYDTLPKLVFTEITEHDYLSLTPHIHSKLENLKIKESESAFSISTRINTIELQKYAKGDMG